MIHVLYLLLATSVREGSGPVVHETIHVFERNPSRGVQHLVTKYFFLYSRIKSQYSMSLGKWANKKANIITFNQPI